MHAWPVVALLLLGGCLAAPGGPLAVDEPRLPEMVVDAAQFDLHDVQHPFVVDLSRRSTVELALDSDSEAFMAPPTVSGSLLLVREADWYERAECGQIFPVAVQYGGGSSYDSVPPGRYVVAKLGLAEGTITFNDGPPQGVVASRGGGEAGYNGGYSRLGIEHTWQERPEGQSLYVIVNHAKPYPAETTATTSVTVEQADLCAEMRVDTTGDARTVVAVLWAAEPFTASVEASALPVDPDSWASLTYLRWQQR